MGENKTGVEVKLVRRTGTASKLGTNAYKTKTIIGDAQRAWSKTFDDNFITILHEISGGICQQNISLKEYLIDSVTFRPEGWDNVEAEFYSNTKKEQEEAFEMVFCGIEESIVMAKDKENKVGTANGPRRLELALVGRALPNRKVVVVVTDLMSPNGNFNIHTVTGRVWSADGKKLSDETETFWSLNYNLSRVTLYVGGNGGTATNNFLPMATIQGWEFAASKWLTHTHTDVIVVQHWDADVETQNDEDELEMYGYGYAPGYSSVYTRVPHSYKASPAHYRVAGDRIGAIINSEQKEAFASKQSEKPVEKKSALPVVPHQTRTGCTNCGALICYNLACIEAGKHVKAHTGVTIH